MRRIALDEWGSKRRDLHRPYGCQSTWLLPESPSDDMGRIFTFRHLLETRGTRGSETHALFGMPDPDNLVNPHGGQLFAITAPGDVRHYMWGGYLDVPWTKRREVWCLTETDDQTWVKDTWNCRKSGSLERVVCWTYVNCSGSICGMQRRRRGPLWWRNFVILFAIRRHMLGTPGYPVNWDESGG